MPIKAISSFWLACQKRGKIGLFEWVHFVKKQTNLPLMIISSFVLTFMVDLRKTSVSERRSLLNVAHRRPKTIHLVPGGSQLWPPIFALVFLNTYLPSPLLNLNRCFRLLSIFHYSDALEGFLFPTDHNVSLSLKSVDDVLVLEVLRE